MAESIRGGYHTRMTPDHFQTTVRAFQRRAPFRPYVVELVSDDRVQVDHPEALVIRGGVAVFVNAAGAPVIIRPRRRQSNIC